MIEFLRLLGMLNAAVWLGTTCFYVFAVGPLAGSDQMTNLLGRNSAYFAQSIEQFLAARFFKLQLVCGIVAVFHLAAEWLYLGRVPRRAWLALLGFLLAATLFGGLAVQPRLQRWNTASHAANYTPPQQQAAARFRHSWHTVWTVLNFTMLGGLAVYYWRLGSTSGPPRFVSPTPFRG